MNKSTVFAPMLIVFVALLFGCGGGGGSSGPSVTGVNVTLTITPSLGQFSQGSVVRVKNSLGNLVGSGVVGANGTAAITLLANTMPPLLIEVGMNGDSFFDEKLGRNITITGLPTDGAAIRAAVPDLSRTNIGVTAITEIAASQLLNLAGQVIGSPEILSINQMIGARFSISDPLAPPTIVGPNTLTLNPALAGSGDEYALKLAAIANLAKPGQNALDVTQLLRDDMADGLFDGMATKTFDNYASAVREAFFKPASITGTAYSDATAIQNAFQNAIDIAQAKYASTSPRISMNLPPVCDPLDGRLLLIPTNLSYQTLQMIRYTDTVIDPKNPNLIYTIKLAGKTIVGNVGVGMIGISTDGGVTWKLSGGPGHNYQALQIAINPVNTAHLLKIELDQTSVYGNTYTFESLDSGVTWSSVIWNGLEGMAFVPSSTHVYGFRNPGRFTAQIYHPLDYFYSYSSTISIPLPAGSDPGQTTGQEVGRAYERIYGFAIDPQQTINPKLYLVTDSFKVLAITLGCAANN